MRATHNLGNKRRFDLALKEIVKVDALEEELLPNLGGVLGRGAETQGDISAKQAPHNEGGLHSEAHRVAHLTAGDALKDFILRVAWEGTLQ